MTDIADARAVLKRDSLVTALIGVAHFTSHFFQLSIAPLFPLLHDAFDVNYVKLGSLVTTMYLVSGICQAFAGIIVDRFGSRPVLLAGIAAMATCIGLAGFVTDFWMFYPLMALAGVGNSVFHPADFAALSHQVSKPRLGRAYSVHAFSGTIGYAVAPAVIGSTAYMAGWRPALIGAGVFGWLVALAVWRFGHHFLKDDHVVHAAHAHQRVSYRQMIAMPAILLAFGYFLFTAGASTAVQTFSTTSLVDSYGVGLAAAASVLSAYLIGTAVGILLGGFLADHTRQHVSVAVIGLGLAAFSMMAVASGVFPFSMAGVAIAVAGLCQGLTAPSRDILVKAATPPGSTGTVFGFVYSGLDAGSTLAPLLFGFLADRHAYHATFAGIALLLAAGIFTVIKLGNRGKDTPARP